MLLHNSFFIIPHIKHNVGLAGFNFLKNILLMIYS